jgi:hypothetical protein
MSAGGKRKPVGEHEVSDYSVFKDIPTPQDVPGGKRKPVGGRNVDPNGYVVDGSNAPAEPGAGAGKSGRNVDPDGYVLDGSGGPSGPRPIVYASYVEGSTGGATDTGVYGMPIEYEGVGGGGGVYGRRIDPTRIIGSVANAMYSSSSVGGGIAVYGDEVQTTV